MDPKRVTQVVWTLSWAALLSCPPGAATANGPQEPSLTRSYTVGKRVSEFPPRRDLSTPEAAYAIIMRDFMATGASGAEWSEISLRPQRGTQRTPVAAEYARDCLEAYIEEVIIYRDRLAFVIAKLKEHGAAGYDRRDLFLRGGRWLNAGQGDLEPTLEAARAASLKRCESSYYESCVKQAGAALEPRWNRPPVADPESHLKPYVEFLREHGRQPHAFLMEALAKYSLVVMGEVHNRPTYWAFNRELVRDPAFARTVGTIYLEQPSNHQHGIDAFLAAATCQKDFVIQMLRDYHDGGWPCAPTLEFFVAVWQVNQKLPPDQKLRLRLVDQQWPWEKIHAPEDWQAYRVDRDLFMAQNILKDRQTNPDPRHGFFIVGMQHAMEGLCVGDRTTPRPSAGWYLKQALGDQLFTVFQHTPIVTDHGETSGRLALGLIDSAFAALQDRPVAFGLREGPFGRLPFDGMPDAKVYGSFRDGYDAYLYLIPLEEERFSPLIEGFYSKEFVREVDRRSRLRTGTPLFPDMDASTPERLTRLRQATWGQPRHWIRDLGPRDAWRHGDAWYVTMAQERQRRATRQELVEELDKIYRGLKAIDAREDFSESWQRAFGFDYLARTQQGDMYSWWRRVIPEHPLEGMEYGELSHNKDGLPRIPVTTTLQGGIRFSTTFDFQYLALPQRWQAQHGLDMHLDPQWKDLPTRRK
jgi:hypothetical protein